MARAVTGRSGTAPTTGLPRVEVARGEFGKAAARVLARCLRSASREEGEARGDPDAGSSDRGRALSLALAGGSTPRAAYRRLAAEPDLPWPRIRIYFGDERRVPPGHAESNYRMAREALLSHLPTRPAAVHPMDGDAADPEAAATAYAALLPDALDLLILGIGEDGHTASLFPGAPALREERRRVVPAVAPVEPRERLTITPPVIRAARRVVVLARGAGKAEAVARALEGPRDPAACPAQLARQGVWVLDLEAASALRDRPDVEIPEAEVPDVERAGGRMPGPENP